MRTDEIHIYEVEWYYKKSYCRSMADYKKPIILRFESSHDAYQQFEALRHNKSVWQAIYRTITQYGFLDLDNCTLFKEQTVRETRYMNNLNEL